MNKKMLFIGIALILIGAFLLAMIVYQNSQPTSKVAEHSENIVRADAPMKGNAAAKVTIVEFLDPACETCAAFYPFMNEVMAKYPNKIQLIVRYAPLHKNSDKVVRLLEAAHLQGQFWPALERLFAYQSKWTLHHVSQPQIARKILKDLPLDQTKFTQDIYSQQVTEALNADLADVKKLKVRATPEFFVYGRQMQTFGYQQLLQLIEEEIAKNY